LAADRSNRQNHAHSASRLHPDTQQDLFGGGRVQRDASVDRIEGFIHERLAQCFPAVAKGMVLKNSKASPMYLLCFVASNEKGAKPALKIAQHILGE
jgi:hypothetical protein